MKKKINKNLIGIALLATILTLVMTSLVYFHMTQRQVMDDLRTHVHILNSSEYVLEYLEDNYDPGEDQLRITVVSGEGDVLYESSNADAQSMENHMARPEIQDAQKNGEGMSVRRSDTMGTLTFYYAELQDNGNIIRVAREFSYLSRIYAVLIPEMLAVYVGILILCMVLGHLMTRRFVEPIEILAGDVNHADGIPTYPEIQPFVNKINQQHRELKRSSRLRQEFTANVSHELKTPLTSISGYAELIETGIATEDNAMRFAGEIYKNAQRLLTLINDILRLSQLDSVEDAVVKESVDLYAVALNCRDMLEMHANQNRVAVRVKGRSIFIRANKQMMDELIYNLCDNAIRYNRVGGQVYVNLEEKEEGVLLSVRDTGIGISEADQERIFERFYRVDKSRSKQTGGTGLGLAIVKHIALLHRAEISVSSTLGEGTEFSVVFPPDSVVK